MQSLLNLAFPPQCLSCGSTVETLHALCGACWSETPFLTGLVCDACGVPLPGSEAGEGALCDACLATDRPWQTGRAVLAYSGVARKLVLALKHGDRLDLVRPFGGWMARAAAPMLRDDTVIVAVPLHPFRLLRRRYNQAALLSNAMARHLQRPSIPDLLTRSRRTVPQEGMTRAARFANQSGAIRPGTRAVGILAGRSVLLVDDVMTSGATFAAAAEASYAAGAERVDVLALARAVKAP